MQVFYEKTSQNTEESQQENITNTCISAESYMLHYVIICEKMKDVNECFTWLHGHK